MYAIAFAFAVAAALLTLAQPARASDADDRFKALYTAEWTWRTAQFPGIEDGGAQPQPDRLPDVGAKAQHARLGYWSRVLEQLATIPVDSLSAANRVNYAVFKAQIGNLAAEVRFRAYEMPLNSDSQFWSDRANGAVEVRLKDDRDARNYLAWLADVPAYIDQQITNMRAGIARGFTVPRAVLTGIDQSIASETGLANPETSAFYAPLKALPASIPAADQERMRAQARQLIGGRIEPAYATLLKFFRDDYVPHARTTLAAEALPDGKAYYRQQLREYTTLDKSPDEIHAIGLREVAKIHGEMQAVMHSTGFTGDFPAFLQFLRTDPRFYAKTPEELLMRSAWIAKEVDGKLDRFFGHLPRARFTIKPVPAAIAPFYTSGRGGPDVYLVNTYDLPSRALFNVPALTLHESYPGHALQLELADEQTNQPPFRSHGYISAYGEGWGLYSEFLGTEMGIYKTPYEKFGYLTYQMWRACRLVVDTGIHHLGWTREQAVAYLRDNTALSDHEIDTEVNRYISWPGQADSYYLGYLEILALRARAEKALGTKFDLRRFHDTILAAGSVPLPELSALVDRYIAAGGPEPEWPCDCAGNRDRRATGG